MQALIIDDEKHCREVLNILLTKHCPDVETITLYSNPLTALQAVETTHPDIVFLDIEMPGMNGFEFLERCTHKNFAVVFTTAYNEYAIQAIKNNALDYLLKPVDVNELVKAVDKCKLRKQSSTQGININKLLDEMLYAHKNIHKERFVVHTRNKWIPVDVEQIAFFYRNLINYLVTFTGERHPITQTTLDEVEAMLDPKFFFRANRQYIINIKAIDSVKVEPSGILQITPIQNNKEEIEVSRKKAPEFRKWLGV